MASDWRTVQFSQLCDITRGASPRPIQDWVAAEGVPWIKISDANASYGRFITRTRERIKQAGRFKSVVVYPGDLILSNSATPGIPKFLGIEACIHDGWLLLRNFRGLDKTFAYYLLLAQRDALVGKGNGSVFTNLKTEILKNHTVAIPPLEEQQRIAAFLGEIDDRLELMEQSNATLEAIAQTLFKSWFVDFDPVRAKAEGLEPEGMDSATAALFPSEFQNSELGLIPKGWRVTGLGQCCDNIRKQAKLEALDVNTPYIGLEHMPRKSIALCDWDSADGLASGKFWHQPGDVLFGKLRPYFHKVGVASREGVCSTDILVIRAKSTTWFGFAAMHLSSDGLISYATQLSNGARMPRTNWNDLAAYKVVIPDEMCGLAFSEIAAPLIQRIHTNIDFMRSLANLRDTLLTRLVSGTLRLCGAPVAIQEDLA